MTETLSVDEISWRRWLTRFVGLAAFLFAVYSVRRFLQSDFPTSRAVFVESWDLMAILFFWTFAPAVWFFFEYFFLWYRADEKFLGKVKTGQDLAKTFWAAVLATLLFLIPK